METTLTGLRGTDVQCCVVAEFVKETASALILLHSIMERIALLLDQHLKAKIAMNHPVHVSFKFFHDTFCGGNQQAYIMRIQKAAEGSYLTTVLIKSPWDTRKKF